MANVFKNARGVGAVSYQTIYTCPAGTVATLLGIQAANVDGQNPVNVSAQWLDSSGGGAATRLAHEVTIPSGSSLGLLSGTFVLEAGDSLQVSCSAAGKAEFSIGLLQMT